MSALGRAGLSQHLPADVFPPEQAEVVAMRRLVREFRNKSLNRSPFGTRCFDLAMGIARRQWLRGARQSLYEPVIRALRDSTLAAEAINAGLVAVWCAQASVQHGLDDTSLHAYAGKLLLFIGSLDGQPLFDIGTEDVADFLGQQVTVGNFLPARAAVYHLLRLPLVSDAIVIDRKDPELWRSRDRQPARLILPAAFDRVLAGQDPSTALDASERWLRLTRRAAACLGHLGLRIGEVWRLKLRDVDRSIEGQVLVRRSKRGVTRRVPWRPFPDAWRQYVVEYVTEVERRWPERGLDGALFVRESGEPFPRPADIARLIVPELRSVVGDWVTFHALRTAGANLLMALGYDVRTIALRLGHASVWSTLWYLHLLDALPWRQLRPMGPGITSAELALLGDMSQRTARRRLRARVPAGR